MSQYAVRGVTATDRSEAEAGTALVNRATLTQAGRILVDHAERILVELRAAEATLAGRRPR